MEIISFLKEQIKLLKSFSYVQAYTGQLNKLEENTYVLYDDIVDKINELVVKVNKLETILRKSQRMNYEN